MKPLFIYLFTVVMIPSFVPVNIIDCEEQLITHTLDLRHSERMCTYNILQIKRIERESFQSQISKQTIDSNTPKLKDQNKQRKERK
jgi:hypothetical protein